MADSSAGDFDLSTAVPVASASAAPTNGSFDLSTATPVNPADAPPETVGRVAGLATRAALSGAAGFAGTVAQNVKQNFTDAFTSDAITRQQQRDAAAPTLSSLITDT